MERVTICCNFSSALQVNTKKTIQSCEEYQSRLNFRDSEVNEDYAEKCPVLINSEINWKVKMFDCCWVFKMLLHSYCQNKRFNEYKCKKPNVL